MSLKMPLEMKAWVLEEERMGGKAGRGVHRTQSLCMGFGSAVDHNDPINNDT